MAEENIEEILGIEETTPQCQKSGGIFDHAPEEDTQRY